MEITVTIPDDLATQASVRGLTPESYVEELIAQQSRSASIQVTTADRLADLESFFREMTAPSSKVPILPDDALSRESFYRDHD